MPNNPFRYRGYYYDKDLNLYYLNARYYDRGTGRFVNQLFGWQIELGVIGDAISSGAEATIGIFDGAFEAKVNAGTGVGGGFVFRIKPG